ncbi:MAG: alpha/beta hydrolase [Phaeodactylibacter sp.]|uniref:alpha/beta fold hydrolase n=1 Tax=Phaeodactylibacter sp. TaxID=1940289 RepID=UPI0032EEBF59
MTSFFKSEAGRAVVLSLYDQKLQALGMDHQAQTIRTQFGHTNVLITGPVDGPPLMLLHGSNGCAPIALETYPNLAEKYRVYAVDVLAQPNKSEGERLSMSDLSYGQWVNELLIQLGLESVTLAGFSFGGLIILKTLAFDESLVKAAYLAAPAYIVNGNPLKLLWKMFIPMKRYMKTAKPKHIRRFLSEIFTDDDPFALAFLAQVFLHFEMDFTPVPVMSKTEAGRIRTPITLFAAQQDIVFPGEKMIKRARKLFPNLRQTVLFEDSKHVQGRTHNDQIEKLILEA